MFADDTQLSVAATNLGELEKLLNRDITNLDIWLRANRLAANATKTLFMVISIYLSTYLFIHPSIHPSITLPTEQPSIHPSICLSIYLSTCLFTYLPTYLPTLLPSSLYLVSSLSVEPSLPSV